MNKKFVQSIKGRKILGVARRAKMIIINLSGDKHLLIHLKMTGQLVFRDRRGKGLSGGHPIAFQGELPTKFTRAAFEFADKSHLFFNDIRRFGWIKFADRKLYENETAKYGLEPLSKDFTFSAFKEKLKRYPNRKIKQVLMDQTLIAGVGNIYADEICFAARVLPARPTNKLTEQEIKDLFKAIPRILKLSISKKGTSADTYVTTSGAEGGMMKYLKVYGRAGEKCRRCGGAVHKIKLGGRGTHFCPICQK
jgi:formamidopyrimidine-DNA glycosylase